MLHYRTYKKDDAAPWVTFIHGAGGSSSIWFLQIKEFRKQFNVLLIDLRGHGKSTSMKPLLRSHYNIVNVSREVVDVLDFLKIDKSHFIGISLGTIIIRQISEQYPQRVSTMIMGGAIMRLNLRAKFLVAMGNFSKRFVPYMWLYSLFAWIIMPRARHKKSRSLFINEARKVAQKEFMRWFRMTKTISPILRYFNEKDTGIPTLYLMGDEDHMFLPTVEHIASRHASARLEIIQDSGHVCNVDQPEIFNKLAIDFLGGKK